MGEIISPNFFRPDPVTTRDFGILLRIVWSLPFHTVNKSYLKTLRSSETSPKVQHPRSHSQPRHPGWIFHHSGYDAPVPPPRTFARNILEDLGRTYRLKTLPPRWLWCRDGSRERVAVLLSQLCAQQRMALRNNKRGIMCSSTKPWPTHCMLVLPPETLSRRPVKLA